MAIVLNNETEFCIIEFTVCNISRYLLWCTDDKDYFLTDKNKKVVYFSQKEKMEEYCKKGHFQNPSFVSNNFDILDYHDCNDYLNKWNIIDDLSNTRLRTLIMSFVTFAILIFSSLSKVGMYFFPDVFKAGMFEP